MDKSTDTNLNRAEPAVAAFGDLERKIAVLAGIFIVTGLIIALMAISRKPPEVQKRRDPSLAVMAMPAYESTVVLDVVVQGQSRPRTEVDLTPQVGGKVTYVSPQFVAGGVFKKGDVLLRLEEADYNVAVLRAEAGVARAQQLVIREEAEGAIARADWEDLGRGGEPSPLTLRKPQLEEAKANLLSAQADLDNAKLQLSRTVIRAPFTGRIRNRFADVGQFVGPGTRLAQVFSTEAIEVPLSLNDADLMQLDVPVSMAVTDRDEAPDVTLSAVIGGKRQEWQGKIVRTDGVFDPQTRTISAIAEVRDPFGAGASADGTPLPPGLFVDAKIRGRTLENAIIIPRDGLRPEDKVYVVGDDAKAQSRDAVVLHTNVDRAVLQSGVTPGELVVISPLEKSQISLTFKVLDATDPTVVLIEPPKTGGPPEGADKKKKDEKKGFFSRFRKDDKNKDDAAKDDGADATKKDESPSEGNAKAPE